MAWSLCSKSDVVSIHPTRESDLQDFWSDAVESLIREHLGTPDLGRQTAITNELHSGDGLSSILLVRRPPIVSVTSLTVNGIPVGSDGYVVSLTSIELLGTVFPAGQLNVAASYVSGSLVDQVTGLAVVDPIIRLTAAAMIVALVQYKSRAGSDGTLKWGNAEQMEGGKSPVYNVGLTSHLQTIMRRMLRRQRVRIS